MNIKHTLISTLMGVSILLGSVSPIFAQSPTLENRQEGELHTERRCDRVNAHIDARIRHFNDRRNNVIARQRRTLERITEFVNRMEGKGYDVSKVRTDLKTPQGMIQTAESNYAAFIKELEETKHFDCGDHRRGDFKQAVEESRAALVKFRSDVKATRDFVRNTLRPDLQALRGQNPSPTPTK